MFGTLNLTYLSSASRELPIIRLSRRLPPNLQPQFPVGIKDIEVSRYHPARKKDSQSSHGRHEESWVRKRPKCRERPDVYNRRLVNAGTVPEKRVEA